MKRALLKYQLGCSQLAAVSSTAQAPQAKLGSLCRALDKSYYLRAVCDVFKGLSGLMYNHHLIARFHSSQRDGAAEELRQRIAGDRRQFWQHVQEKVVGFF